LLAGTHLETLDALRTTYFGRVLGAKAAVVVVAVALAAWHKLGAARAMTSLAAVERFRRTLWIELLLVHIVFYGAALMTSASMPGMSHGDSVALIAGFTLKRWSELLVIAIAVGLLATTMIESRRRLR
jgi:putative copper export protein